MKIEHAEARSVPDTRGRPTVEATLRAGALSATASVPSGKSTGSYEACELRDADGGVGTAVANVTGEIAEALAVRGFASADELDEFLIALDGTPDKSRLGANAILAVSIAAQRLFAQVEGVPLWKAIEKRGGFAASAPRLFVNVMNGGTHADFRLPFQEYILVCEGKTSSALATARTAFAELGKELGSSTGLGVNNVPMGDEGGYAPAFAALDEPFEILAGLVATHPGMSIAIDAAANELRDGAGGYRFLGKRYSPEELTMLYHTLVERYPFHSIEDPFSEDATEDFAKLTAALNSPSTPLGTTTRVLVVGDDFTVTNPARIAAARETQAITAVLIKPNQIGTLKEAIEAVQKTHAVGWAAIASHRSGETDDTFIADFAYGVGAHGIKAGGLGQRARLEKYERLLEIEHEAESLL